MNEIQKCCKTAKDLGAKDAKIISPSGIGTASWVRLKCQFGCDGYGRGLTCPPFSPTPEETRKTLDSFKPPILLHGDDNGRDISEIVLELEKEIFLAGFYKAFGMGSGPCRLCPTCNVKTPCKKGYEARPSMEASGIDVFATARSAGFKIEVLKSTGCKANYFGVVLVE